MSNREIGVKNSIIINILFLELLSLELGIAPERYPAHG
jgi:hypothetical protein